MSRPTIAGPPTPGAQLRQVDGRSGIDDKNGSCLTNPLYFFYLPVLQHIRLTCCRQRCTSMPGLVPRSEARDDWLRFGTGKSFESTYFPTARRVPTRRPRPFRPRCVMARVPGETDRRRRPPLASPSTSCDGGIRFFSAARLCTSQPESSTAAMLSADIAVNPVT
jgi:hypothetical protein